MRAVSARLRWFSPLRICRVLSPHRLSCCIVFVSVFLIFVWPVLDEVLPNRLKSRTIACSICIYIVSKCLDGVGSQFHVPTFRFRQRFECHLVAAFLRRARFLVWLLESWSPFVQLFNGSMHKFCVLVIVRYFRLFLCETAKKYRNRT